MKLRDAMSRRYGKLKVEKCCPLEQLEWRRHEGDLKYLCAVSRECKGCAAEQQSLKGELKNKVSTLET